jgi:hypothetical protein
MLAVRIQVIDGTRTFTLQDSQPCRLLPPVNASPTPSRATAHDSGPLWFATPSMQWTFTIYSSPVFPAHL